MKKYSIGVVGFPEAYPIQNAYCGSIPMMAGLLRLPNNFPPLLELPSQTTPKTLQPWSLECAKKNMTSLRWIIFNGLSFIQKKEISFGRIVTNYFNSPGTGKDFPTQIGL